MKLFQPLIIVSLAYLAVACSDGKSRFVVEGTVSDADSSVLYLEKREINNITLLDSVRLNSKGDFKFKDTSTPYPEFYVLRMDGQVINFAVDSAETVKVGASKSSFATDYSIEGNLANQQIKSVVLAQYKASQRFDRICHGGRF